jgi:hypothetical protein
MSGSCRTGKTHARNHLPGTVDPRAIGISRRTRTRPYQEVPVGIVSHSRSCHLAFGVIAHSRQPGGNARANRRLIPRESRLAPSNGPPAAPGKSLRLPQMLRIALLPSSSGWPRYCSAIITPLANTRVNTETHDLLWRLGHPSLAAVQRVPTRAVRRPHLPAHHAAKYRSLSARIRRSRNRQPLPLPRLKRSA